MKEKRQDSTGFELRENKTKASNMKMKAFLDRFGAGAGVSCPVASFLVPYGPMEALFLFAGTVVGSLGQPIPSTSLGEGASDPRLGWQTNSAPGSEPACRAGEVAVGFLE